MATAKFILFVSSLLATTVVLCLILGIDDIGLQLMMVSLIGFGVIGVYYKD